MGAQRQVKAIYASIVQRAVEDFEQFPYMRLEIEKFFTSAWGQGILDVLGIPYDAIDSRLGITETCDLCWEVWNTYLETLMSGNATPDEAQAIVAQTLNLELPKVCEIVETVKQARRWENAI